MVVCLYGSLGQGPLEPIWDSGFRTGPGQANLGSYGPRPGPYGSWPSPCDNYLDKLISTTIFRTLSLGTILETYLWKYLSRTVLAKRSLQYLSLRTRLNSSLEELSCTSFLWNYHFGDSLQDLESQKIQAEPEHIQCRMQDTRHAKKYRSGEGNCL